MSVQEKPSTDVPVHAGQRKLQAIPRFTKLYLFLYFRTRSSISRRNTLRSPSLFAFKPFKPAISAMRIPPNRSEQNLSASWRIKQTHRTGNGQTEFQVSHARSFALLTSWRTHLPCTTKTQHTRFRRPCSDRTNPNRTRSIESFHCNARANSPK
jgi:hypothetical protein